MGLFGKLFSKKDKDDAKDVVEEQKNSTSYDVHKEINCILSILSHLGLLDPERIEKSIEKEEDYDESILYRLMIRVNDDNITALKRFLEFQKLGYGEEKINIYHRRLVEYSRQMMQLGKNREEVIEEIISIIRTEIDNYEVILKNLNEEVKRVEENSKNNEEVLAMVDFLKQSYEEQELGYPINLENRVRVMANELAQLPYGGYGEDEIEMFTTAAKKIIEEGKLNHEESSHTLSRIKVELYNPKKNRYTSDLETLKKKLAMIQDSTYISDFEKEQNRLKTISEFNQMNGHKMGIKETISRLKKSLEEMEYGGFGKIVTDNFEKKANQIYEELSHNEEKDDVIIKEIQKEYHKLAVQYETHLKKLKEKIKEIQDDEFIEDKQRRVDEALEYFHDEMGHPIDYRDRIHQMSIALKGLEYGGYSEDMVNSFENDAIMKAKDIESHDELANCMKQIRRKYNDYIHQYEKASKELTEKIEELKKSKKTDKEKEQEEKDLTRGFQAKFGHSISYEDLIEENAKILSSLDHGGYGKKTLDNYRYECHKILGLEKDQEKIYEEIQQEFYKLRDYYNHNLELFTEWKNLQLKDKKGNEKIELEKDLDTKITYMLSLSADELYDYYMEDDRKKKAEAYRHNYMAAFRYLAREEARKKKNKSLYDRRLKELAEGQQPYSNGEIDLATKKLESNFDGNDELPEEDRIISLIEYIDSTLLRQMLYVETSLADKKDLEKI